MILQEHTSRNREKKISQISYFTDLKIGVLIPAYNEEKNIGMTLSKFPKFISRNIDIIVINDGSTDNTDNIANNYGIIYLEHKKNKGYGAAIRTGLEYCKNRDFDVIVLMDADGQHDPNELFQLIEPIIYGEADFVIGNRFQFPYNMTSIKKLYIKIMCVFYFICFRRKINDPTNGFRALTSHVVEFLKLESDYSISQEMLMKILPYYRCKEVPIRIYKRENGHSFISLRKYFFKMILMLLKFYIFPKIRGITCRWFDDELRRIIGIYALKT